MPTVLVRGGSRDNFLWDGVLSQLTYYIEMWIKESTEEDPLILDFSRCRCGVLVSNYIYSLMERGIKCINSTDMPGLSEIYDALQEAAKGNCKYHYVPIDIKLSYEDIVKNAKYIKEVDTSYDMDEHEGKELCYYVRESDVIKHMNTNIVSANMSYYMLTRLSLKFDPFYNGKPNSELHNGTYNKFLLKDVFKFILNVVKVPTEFYDEYDKSIWIVNDEGLIQKLQFNEKGRLYKENGLDMYYYPGYGWYTLSDLRRMGLYPLPGFLFEKSISQRPDFLRSLKLACMKINPSNITKKKEKGSELLKFLEMYKDVPRGDYNE